MRIFVLASWYPSERDPQLGVFVEEQALALKQRHEVAVLAPFSVTWRQTVAGRGRPPATIEKRRGLDVVRVPAGSPLPWSWRIREAAYARAARRAFDEAVRTFGEPDLIHAHVVIPGGDAAVRIAASTGVPMVLTEHSNPFSMHLYDEIHRRRTFATLAHADAVVAVSPALREDMLAFRPETSVAVVGNVVDTEFFSPAPGGPQIGRSEFRLLSVGLLTRSKGMHNVLEAFARALPRISMPTSLTIVGDGPERYPLQAQAQDLGIENRVTFVGNLDRAGVRDALRSSDGFVLGSDTETFGVVVAESMACMCPVIATRSGGPDWVVPDGAGLLVRVGDAASLAEGIAALISGRYHPNLEAARRSVVERFAPGAVVDQLEKVYRSVLASRPS